MKDQGKIVVEESKPKDTVVKEEVRRLVPK